MVMNLVAQRDELVFIQTRKKGIFLFGFLVDYEKMKVNSKELNLLSVLKGGDWEIPNLSKRKEDMVLSLLASYLESIQKD